jgi:hypothetical protein
MACQIETDFTLNFIMTRALKVVAFCSVVIGALFAGYWFGTQRASHTYERHFFSEAFTREIREAKNDLGVLEALEKNKLEVALQVTQYRYYSRLLVASEIVQKSDNPASQLLLKSQVIEAHRHQQAQPYRFPSDTDQKQWEILVKASQ